MRCVLKAALDLSTSTKPFDSVTAAHLLHLLLPQSDLNQALLHCAQEQDLHFQLPSPSSQPSKPVILELNTLAGMIQIHSPNKCMYVCSIRKNDIYCPSAPSGSVLAALSAV